MVTTSGESASVDLPRVDTLTQAQVRGRACVWCSVALSNATAVNLGERTVDAHGSRTHWFPRACRPCAKTNVYKALLDHTQSCEQCNDTPALCEAGSSLRATLKVARR